MTEIIREWVLSLASCALICAVLTATAPEGRVKAVQRMVCGVIMAAALFSPLLRLDFGSYSVSLAKYESQARSIVGDAEKISDSLSRKYIEEQCAAYILDKAQTLGLSVASASVEVLWSGEGVWYPVSARIDGAYSGELARAIEANLGIPQGSQTWSKYEEA